MFTRNTKEIIKTEQTKKCNKSCRVEEIECVLRVFALLASHKLCAETNEKKKKMRGPTEQASSENGCIEIYKNEP